MYKAVFLLVLLALAAQTFGVEGASRIPRDDPCREGQRFGECRCHCDVTGCEWLCPPAVGLDGNRSIFPDLMVFGGGRFGDLDREVLCLQSHRAERFLLFAKRLNVN